MKIEPTIPVLYTVSIASSKFSKLFFVSRIPTPNEKEHISVGVDLPELDYIKVQSVRQNLHNIYNRTRADNYENRPIDEVFAVLVEYRPNEETRERVKKQLIEKGWKSSGK